MSFAIWRALRAAAVVLAISFAVPAHADYTLTCGSVEGRHQTCRLSEPGYVTLVRQISGARCEQGRSWDYDRREIWVDRGCEAEFRVERWGYKRDASGPSSDGRRDTEVAAVVIAGAAILGALANNKDHRDDHKYRDENYYGPRHTSYVPGWMVGTFSGYNPMYGADVEMTIRSDGRMTAVTNGRTLVDGYVNDHQLHVGPAIFAVDQTREGFVTSQKGDRANEVRYRRIR